MIFKSILNKFLQQKSKLHQLKSRDVMEKEWKVGRVEKVRFAELSADTSCASKSLWNSNKSNFQFSRTFQGLLRGSLDSRAIVDTWLLKKAQNSRVPAATLPFEQIQCRLCERRKSVKGLDGESCEHWRPFHSSSTLPFLRLLQHVCLLDAVSTQSCQRLLSKNFERIETSAC